MSQRFEGRNLEDALNHASEALGVERWQLTYHVLLEKRGFLGGVKRIVIEADVNREAPPPAAAPASGDAPYAEARPPRSDRGSGGRRGRGGGGERRRDAGTARRGRRGRGREESDFRTGDFETFLGDVPEQGPESDAARSVREWCETALSLAKIDVVARSQENDTQIIVKLYGNDGRRLTERHGELLDAVQVLANKTLVGRSVEKDVELDCEEFKERRAEDLGQRAREVADRVREDGQEELMPAMTPIERRIVHLALRDDADVTTESRGEGFYKRVAIILRSETEETPDTP